MFRLMTTPPTVRPVLSNSSADIPEIEPYDPNEIDDLFDFLEQGDDPEDEGDAPTAC